MAVNERVLVTTLTKRMAEDLTDYLAEHGVKVRYLHSDIDTVERVEIIRDLRKGLFDVLVGINLLREGLDIPEVSLVAILDADKEGFLRSGRSLIQTIGRAARHINGTAILYADHMTDSMKAAIDETDRRRAKQVAFNLEHGIEPKGISKRIKDMIDGVYDPDEARETRKAAQEEAKYDALSEKQLDQRIRKLEKEMLEAARNLEFERAASLRVMSSKMLRDRLMASRGRRVHERHLRCPRPRGLTSAGSAARGGVCARPDRAHVGERPRHRASTSSRGTIFVERAMRCKHFRRLHPAMAAHALQRMQRSDARATAGARASAQWKGERASTSGLGTSTSSTWRGPRSQAAQVARAAAARRPTFARGACSRGRTRATHCSGGLMQRRHALRTRPQGRSRARESWRACLAGLARDEVRSRIGRSARLPRGRIAFRERSQRCTSSATPGCGYAPRSPRASAGIRARRLLRERSRSACALASPTALAARRCASAGQRRVAPELRRATTSRSFSTSTTSSARRGTRAQGAARRRYVIGASTGCCFERVQPEFEYLRDRGRDRSTAIATSRLFDPLERARREHAR